MRKLPTAILGAYMATACSAGIGAKFGVGSGAGAGSGSASTAPEAAPTETASGETPAPGEEAATETAIVTDSKETKKHVQVQTAAIGGYSGADGLDLILDAGRNLYYVSHKIGPVAETSCSDRFGYSAFEAVAPPAKRIELAGIPDGELKACIVTVTEVPPVDAPIPIEGANEVVWIKDTGAPALPVPATIVGAPLATGEVQLTYPAASDAIADASQLTYQVFFGDPAVADPAALVTGGAAAGAPLAGATLQIVTGLTPGNSYAFTVVVTDPAGNVAHYPISIVTAPAPSGATPDGGSPAIVPGSFVLSQTSGLSPTEGGANATFDARLDKAPTHDVTIDVASDNAQATASPATLTFTPGNWNDPQTVTVTAVADLVDDGNQAFTIDLGVAISTDPAFDGVDPAGVAGSAVDIDSAGIVRTPAAGLMTNEGGGNATFALALSSKPTHNVVLAVLTADATEGAAAPGTLTFTPANWNVAQAVTVTGATDAANDGDVAYAINVSVESSLDTVYSALAPSSVGVTNQQLGAFLLSATSGLSATEGGATATFNVTLDKVPTAAVTIAVSSSDATNATVSPASLSFDNTNWNVNHTVTVTAVADLVDDGDKPFTITLGAATSADPLFSGVNPADPTGSAVDADTASIVRSVTSGLVTSESGKTDSFTVKLGSKPTANVVLAVTSLDLTEGTVSPATLTFTAGNYDTTQTVTVTGASDALADGNVAYNAQVALSSSTDTVYAALAAVTVGATNLSFGGITLDVANGVSLTEGDAPTALAVTLSQAPTANVTFSVTSSDPDQVTTDVATLTFTTANWSTPHVVTLTPVADAIADGDYGFTIAFGTATSTDPAYGNFNPPDLNGTVVDIDGGGPPAPITVTGTDPHIVTEAGSTATIDVQLGSAPADTVVLVVESDDLSEGTVSPATLTFTTGNWMTPQTVTVTGQDDGLKDGDKQFFINIYADPTLTLDDAWDTESTGWQPWLNDDDEAPTTARIIPSVTSGLVTSEVGGTDSFTIVLSQAVTDPVGVELYSSNSEIRFDTSSFYFTDGNWNVPQLVTIVGNNDPDADGDKAFTITSAVATSDVEMYQAPSLEVEGTNLDNEGGSTNGALGDFAFDGVVTTGAFDPLYPITWTTSTLADSYELKIFAADCATEIETFAGSNDTSYTPQQTYNDGDTYCFKVSSNNATNVPKNATNNAITAIASLYGPNAANVVSIKLTANRALIAINRSDSPTALGYMYVRQLGPSQSWQPQGGTTYTAGQTFDSGDVKIVCVADETTCTDTLDSPTDALNAGYTVYVYDGPRHYNALNSGDGNTRTPTRHIGSFINDVECGTFNAKEICVGSAQGLGVYTLDMTTAASPKVIDLTVVPGSRAGGLAINGSNAYVADLYGLAVVDLTNAGTGTSATKAYLAREHDTDDVVVRPGGDYAFVVGRLAKLSAIDISDPLHPEITKSVTNLATNSGDMLAINGNDLYLMEGNGSSSFKALYGDPATPGTLMTEKDTVAISAPNGAASLVADPTGSKVMVFQDITGVTPVQVVTGTYDLVELTRTDYLAATPQIADGIKVMDGANEYWVLNAFDNDHYTSTATGVRVMRWDGFAGTPPLAKTSAKDLLYKRAQTRGTTSIFGRAGMGSIGTKLIVSELNHGFSVVDATNLHTTNLTRPGIVSWGDDSNGMAHDGVRKIMFVADADDGVAAIDYAPVATGGFPKTISTTDLPNKQTPFDDGPLEMALSPDRTRLFVNAGGGSISIVDVTDETAMVDLGYYSRNIGVVEASSVENAVPDPNEFTVTLTAGSYDAAWLATRIGASVEGHGPGYGYGGGNELIFASKNDGTREIVIQSDNMNPAGFGVGDILSFQDEYEGIRQLISFNDGNGDPYVAYTSSTYGIDDRITLLKFNTTTDKLEYVVSKSIPGNSHALIHAQGRLLISRTEDISGDNFSFILGYEVDALIAAPGATTYAFEMDVTTERGEGFQGAISHLLADGTAVFSLEGLEWTGRFQLTGGGVFTHVGFAQQDLSSADGLAAPVRIDDRLSFFHRSNCGDGCGACSLSYADVANGTIAKGKMHYIPCEALAGWAVACEGIGGTGICSAAIPGGVSFWQEQD